MTRFPHGSLIGSIHEINCYTTAVETAISCVKYIKVTQEQLYRISGCKSRVDEYIIIKRDVRRIVYPRSTANPSLIILATYE